MNTRIATIGVAALLLVVVGGGAVWRDWPVPGTEIETSGVADPLPVPPVPPRIGEGADYDRCLGMLTSDPDGAAAFATAWEATGGGDTATHCLALSQVALGEPEAGAAMLDKLAAVSRASASARASVFDQATQAWLMAGELEHAYASATHALALSADDPDLLIDRAIAAGNLGRFGDAVEDLGHALEVDPKRADALTLRASGWRQLGRLDTARLDVEAALAIDPDEPEALLERGILRQRGNDPAGARTDWQRAQALAPDSATADLAQQNLALLEAGPDAR